MAQSQDQRVTNSHWCLIHVLSTLVLSFETADRLRQKSKDGNFQLASKHYSILVLTLHCKIMHFRTRKRIKTFPLI